MTSHHLPASVDFRRQVLWVFLFWILAGFAVAPQALAETLIVRVTNGEWPPYQSRELPGYGPASEIVTSAFASQDIHVKYGFFPWARAYALAENGTFDASMIWSYTEERARSFLYSDPLLVSDTVFFHRREKSFDWETYQDLSDQVIGTTIGYFYSVKFESAEKKGLINTDPVSSDELNLRKLLAGRIDLFPPSLEVGQDMMRRMFSEDERAQITWHPKPVRKVYYHLIVSKNSSRAGEWISLFNNGLRTIQANGEYQRILDSLVFPEIDRITVRQEPHQDPGPGQSGDRNPEALR